MIQTTARMAMTMYEPHMPKLEREKTGNWKWRSSLASVRKACIRCRGETYSYVVTRRTATVQNDEGRDQDMRRGKAQVCAERLKTNRNDTGTSDPATSAGSMGSPEGQEGCLRPGVVCKALLKVVDLQHTSWGRHNNWRQAVGEFQLNQLH